MRSTPEAATLSCSTTPDPPDALPLTPAGRPSHRAPHQDPTGRGWGVGALLLANAMTQVPGSGADVVRIGDAARRLAISTRTLQRRARKHVGLSPSARNRRRRLQEAADRSRTHPALGLAAVAAAFGHADQAHPAKDFQSVPGLTPGSHRRSVDQDPPPAPQAGRNPESTPPQPL